MLILKLHWLRYTTAIPIECVAVNCLNIKQTLLIECKNFALMTLKSLTSTGRILMINLTKISRKKSARKIRGILKLELKLWTHNLVHALECKNENENPANIITSECYVICGFGADKNCN